MAFKTMMGPDISDTKEIRERLLCLLFDDDDE